MCGKLSAWSTVCVHDSSITFRNSAQYNKRVVASGRTTRLRCHPFGMKLWKEAEEAVVVTGSGVEEETQEEMHGRLPRVPRWSRAHAFGRGRTNCASDVRFSTRWLTRGPVNWPYVFTAGQSSHDRNQRDIVHELFARHQTARARSLSILLRV